MDIDFTSDLRMQVGQPAFAQPAIPAYGTRTEERRSIPRFFNQAVKNEGESLKQGVPVFDTVEFVEILIAGDAKTAPVKKVTDEVKIRFASEYAKWKTGASQTVSGMPVEQMPGLTVAQVAVLRAQNVWTVEHLAGMSDTQIQSIGLGGRELRAKAKAYIDAAKDSATTMRLAAINEQLGQRIELLEKQIKEIGSQPKEGAPPSQLAVGGTAQSHEPAQSAPRKRGGWPKGKPRPRKNTGPAVSPPVTDLDGHPVTS